MICDIVRTHPIYTFFRMDEFIGVAAEPDEHNLQNMGYAQNMGNLQNMGNPQNMGFGPTKTIMPKIPLLSSTNMQYTQNYNEDEDDEDQEYLERTQPVSVSKVPYTQYGYGTGLHN